LGIINSPTLSNIFLEYALNSSTAFRELITDGKLIAFAGDILVMADNIDEAKITL